MPSSKRKEADEFVRIVREQLLQDGSLPFSEDELKVVLRESIQELPDVTLKTALCENFEEYFEKLRSLSKTRSSKIPEDVSAWRFNALTPKGVKDCLQALKATPYTEEKGVTYKALLATNLPSTLLDIVLHQWIMDTGSSSIKHSLSAVQQSSLLIGTTPKALGQWMKMCVQAYSQLFSKVTKEAVSEEVVQEITEALQSSILSAHLRSTQHKQSADASMDDDAMAALVSLYIDVALIPSHAKRITPEQVGSLVLTVLGHSQEHCLDAVLQSVVSVKKPGLLFPLLRHLLSLCSVNPSPKLYTKYLCCFHRAVHQSHTGQSDVIAVEQLFSKIAPPNQFKQWLWDKNPRLCEAMGLQQSWSVARTVKHLSTGLSEDNIESLLDVVCDVNTLGKPVESVSSVVTNDTPEDVQFFVDTAGEPAQEGQESKISDNVTNLIDKLDFDVDSRKDQCEEMGFMLDRGGMHNEESRTTVLEQDVPVQSDREEKEIIDEEEVRGEEEVRDEEGVRDEEEVSGEEGVREEVNEEQLSITLPIARVGRVDASASLAFPTSSDTAAELTGVEGSVRKRRSARIQCVTPLTGTLQAKVCSSVRSTKRRTVIDEDSDACTMEGTADSHHPELNAGMPEKILDDKREDQAVDERGNAANKNAKKESIVNIDNVASTVVEDVVSDERSNVAASLIEPDDPACVLTTSRKRASATPASTSKRKRADMSAMHSGAETEQTPILLRSSARRKKNSSLDLSCVDDKRKDAIQSEFVLPPLVETEEESTITIEEKSKDVGVDASTVSQAINPEEFTSVMHKNGDASSCLSQTRRKKTTVGTANIDQKKTIGAKKSRSSDFTGVDVESSNESEIASGDPSTPGLVMGRPSPIMLRSLAKLEKGRTHTSIAQVPDSSKHCETPQTMHSLKENKALSLPVRRSSRRL